MSYLSVIISTHNNESTIEKCLRSVRESAYQDYELIIVDDGSQDQTLSLAKKYADKVVKLEKNLGRSHARNIGIQFTGGNIIVNIDSDILVRQGTLAKISDYFLRHPEISAVTGLLSKEHSNPNFFSQYKNLYMHYIFSKLPQEVTFLYGSICAIRRRDAFLYDSAFDLGEDTALGQELASRGKKIAFLRDLEVFHLKKYNFFSFFKNDFQIPFNWTKIFFKYKGWKQLGRNKTGFVHASVGQLLSVMCAPAIVLHFLLSFAGHSFFLGLFLLPVWLLLNIRFVIFMVREKGILFGILAFLVTFLDHLVMASGILSGFCIFLIGRAWCVTARLIKQTHGKFIKRNMGVYTNHSRCITIESVRIASASEWDYIWQNCDYSTYFHSREWAQIWRDYTKGNMYPDPKLVTFTDGKKALLPLSCERILKDMAKRYISSPAGTFGGWLSLDYLERQHAELITDFLVNNFRNIVWRINPYDSLSKVCYTQQISWNLVNDSTWTIDLAQPLSEIHSRMSRYQILRKVRQGEKAGLKINLINSQNILDYYEIYGDCQKRWARSTNSYSISIFKYIFTSRFCDFWGVYNANDILLAAGPILKSKNHVVSWLTLARTQSLCLKPYEFFYWHMINEYKNRGYKWFDFNPSGGHEGVGKFKDSFGTQKLACPIIRVETKAILFSRKISDIKRKIVKAIKNTKQGKSSHEYLFF